MPNPTPHNSQTIAQWAWDSWLSNDSGYPTEVMAWVDNNGRCNSGSFGTQLDAPVTIAGEGRDAAPRPQQQRVHLVAGRLRRRRHLRPAGIRHCDLLALLKWMQANGYAAPGARH